MGKKNDLRRTAKGLALVAHRMSREDGITRAYARVMVWVVWYRGRPACGDMVNPPVIRRIASGEYIAASSLLAESGEAFVSLAEAEAARQEWYDALSPAEAGRWGRSADDPRSARVLEQN